MSIKLGKYIHFKGNEYEAIGIAKHSETSEDMVVYRGLYGEHNLWVRPLTKWNEVVVHNGIKVKRFTHVDELSNIVNEGINKYNEKQEQTKRKAYYY